MPPTGYGRPRRCASWSARRCALPEAAYRRTAGSPLARPCARASSRGCQGGGHAGLSLLARKPEGAPPVLARLAPTVERGVSSRLLAECAEALLATAELGTLRYGAEQNTQAAALARRLEGAGLLPLADAMSGVADARSDGGAAALLRAVHILDRTQAHARPFAWLERSA